MQISLYRQNIIQCIPSRSEHFNLGPPAPREEWRSMGVQKNIKRYLRVLLYIHYISLTLNDGQNGINTA